MRTIGRLVYLFNKLVSQYLLQFPDKEPIPLVGMYTGQPNMDNVLMLLAWTVVSELTLYQLYSVFLLNPFLIPIPSLKFASYNVICIERSYHRNLQLYMSDNLLITTSEG